MTPENTTTTSALTTDLALMTHLTIVDGHVLDARPLADPTEPVVDQGFVYDLDTIVSRRRALRLVGGTFGALVLAACGGSAVDPTTTTAAATTSTAGASSTTAAAAAATAVPAGSSCDDVIPEETAGPYPGDGSNGPDVLSESGVVREDITSSFGGASGVAEGVPLAFELVVLDASNGCTPIEGAAVYAWHCNAVGDYSLYSTAAVDQNWLRGVQAADADGVVRFTSIFPGCYPGRWPHIHFEVFPSLATATDVRNKIATSQIALPQESSEAVYAAGGYGSSASNLSRLSLETDNVFSDDGGASQLATITGDVASGYTARLEVVVNA